MDGVNLPAYTQRFWAKSDRQEPGRIHLLEHHLADVGACFKALLDQPTIRKRLARSGGLDDLDDAAVARLSLLAALHDIGKVNVGFQTRVWRDADFPGGRRPLAFRHVGHYNELVPVLTCEDWRTAEWFFKALGWWDDATKSWDDRGGETVCALLIATLSHHGLPLQLGGNPTSENPAIWRSYGGLDPRQQVRRIGELARRWFPAAFASDADALPSAPAFQHMFLGLCTLADWIGSNETWFPYCDEPRDDYMKTARNQAQQAIDAIGLDVSDQRRFKTTPEFVGLFGFDANAIQRTARETPLDERLVVIESETGSGKTEAALWRFARMYEDRLVDGLYFALPTRAAAVQLHGRVTRFVERLFPAGRRPETVLAVPGYVKAGDIGGRHLQDYHVWWDDHAEGAATQRRWAAESSKRYLAAQIAVGTVDQAMMAALKVKHAHVRAACLARNLLVVDEVHASDAYMSRILRALLDAHLGAGGYALLMSATLGSTARRSWLAAGRSAPQDDLPLEEAVRSPYPAVSTTTPDGESLKPVGENGREKTVSITAEPLMGDFDAAAALALAAARKGAKVLVVRNTVGHAVATQRALEGAAGPGGEGLLFDLDGTKTLHHGRFDAVDRRLLDKRVEELLGREKRPAGGRVVVGTQTLEQSLDIDADLLITDLCPVDVLLQRIGRLHRHPRDDRPDGYREPACVVLTPDVEDLSPLLARGEDRNGLGPHGGVYEDLRVLEATRRLIVQHPQWRIPKMNRKLVERATHPAALEEIVQELGNDESKWREHAISVKGGEIADGLTAWNALIRRDKSFLTDNRDVVFGDLEERIRTRLGDDRVDVALDPPQPSPFDSSNGIDKLAVSVRWLPGADVPESVTPSPVEGGFTFAVGDRSFVYDRLGLRRG